MIEPRPGPSQTPNQAAKYAAPIPAPASANAAPIGPRRRNQRKAATASRMAATARRCRRCRPARRSPWSRVRVEGGLLAVRDAHHALHQRGDGPPDHADQDTGDHRQRAEQQRAPRLAAPPGPLGLVRGHRRRYLDTHRRHCFTAGLRCLAGANERAKDGLTRLQVAPALPGIARVGRGLAEGVLGAPLPRRVAETGVRRDAGVCRVSRSTRARTYCETLCPAAKARRSSAS